MSAAAPPTRPGYLLSHRATLLAMSGLMLGMLVATMNATIVATALPDVVRDVGGLDRYSWVFTGYILAATVTVPVWAGLSDVHGRRICFAAGLVLFMAGSAVGALAGSMTGVVLARTIQGVGSGAVITLAVTCVGDLVPASERGRWQGMLASVLGGGSVLGPLAGGWIVDHAHWRWIFLVSVPLCALALAVVLATLRIPPHPERARSIDWKGAGLLAAGTTGVLLAVVEAGAPDRAHVLEVIAPLLAAIVLLALLVRHERRAPAPIVPLELLREPLFGRIALACFCTGVGLFGSIMFIPLLAQGVLGASASGAALMLMPLMLAMTAGSAASGALIARTGRYRWALLAGPATMAAGYAVLLTVGPASAEVLAGLAAVLLGCGVGLLYQNLVLVLQNEVRSRHLALATSATTMMRNLGSTAGVSVFGALLAAGLPAAAAEASTASPQEMADAMRPIFVCGLAVMAVAQVTVARIPQRALARAVRDDIAAAAAPQP